MGHVIHTLKARAGIGALTFVAAVLCVSVTPANAVDIDFLEGAGADEHWRSKRMAPAPVSA